MKLFKLFWILLFLIGSIVPLFHMNTFEISEQEKRMLTKIPQIQKKGKLNENYGKEFESWLGDHFGGRNRLIKTNAYIMYHIFLEMPKNSDKILGVNGEELYLTPQMIRDLLHLNLKNDQVLRKFAESLQIIDDYLVKKNALFFYYQCWDKHSIYPESVPNYFTPKGEFSKTDKMMEAIELYSNIEVISPKKELIDAKRYMRTYPVTGDVSHWSQKGAYIGYLKLINKINEKSETQYQVLREDDFIVLKEIYSKNIFLKKKNGELTQQKLTADSFNKRHLFFTNDKVENRTRLLIIGDSYFRPVVEMLSESFYEVILVSGDSLHDLKTILDLYNADIVVIEAAERVDRVGGIIKGSERLE